MHTIRSRAPECVAAGGALLATLAVFLPWYATDPANGSSNIDGITGALSAWTVHEAMRYAMLVLCLAPLALSLAALRPNAPVRDLAEIAMVVAVNAVGVVLYFGYLYRPGEPMLTISLQPGWVLALIGTSAVLGAAILRVRAKG